ncbi:OLC1v1014063C1 [Oldenlandia corymbosa var. corymbosa]|uniref:OLC1v1014063C1 n=1 Tax=Oldenlandia corymbosa var. corymbosa TaxID=529605 RepID=A0AAV1E077_OLDCO|nr:OLC1v1014063C1 [Oldenlandia corymbosa var. corymbosa]
MRTTIMAKNTQQELPPKRQFHWTTKVSNQDEELSSSSFKSTEDHPPPVIIREKNKAVPTLQTSISSKNLTGEVKNGDDKKQLQVEQLSANATRKKIQAVAISRLRSVMTSFGRHRGHFQSGLGSRVVGTLFGNRKGHVHFAFQKDPNSQPVFVVELATPITGLVQEMASGLVRIALECDKKDEKKPPLRLLEEPVWRTYCNGKKCGFATRRECGPKEWNVLKAVEPISMGAGVLPAGNNTGGDGGGGAAGAAAEQSDGGEIMYMRAKFERVVGSRDSEAFYMMNPDSNGAPELSIYLLRV